MFIWQKLIIEAQNNGCGAVHQHVVIVNCKHVTHVNNFSAPDIFRSVFRGLEKCTKLAELKKKTPPPIQRSFARSCFVINWYILAAGLRLEISKRRNYTRRILRLDCHSVSFLKARNSCCPAASARVHHPGVFLQSWLKSSYDRLPSSCSFNYVRSQGAQRNTLHFWHERPRRRKWKNRGFPAWDNG